MPNGQGYLAMRFEQYENGRNVKVKGGGVMADEKRED